MSPVPSGAPLGHDRSTPDLVLVWTPDGSEEPVPTLLDSFSASGALRRALVDGEFSEDPRRMRVALLSVGGAALASLYPWLFLPGPDVVPAERAELSEELGAFCADADAVFAEAPAYDGEGAHPLVTFQEWGLSGDGGPSIRGGRGVRGRFPDRLRGGDRRAGRHLRVHRGLQRLRPHGRHAGAYVLAYDYEVFDAATHTHRGTARFTADEPEEGWECPATVPETKAVIDIRAESEDFEDAFTDIVECGGDRRPLCPF